MNPLYKLMTLVYPERCPFCEELIKAKKIACESCLEELKAKRAPIISGAAGSKVVSSFAYGGKVRKMILRMKFYDRIQYISQIAVIMAEDIRQELPVKEIGMITAVPMYKTELKERGYNQSELLAEALSRQLGIPYSPTLEKIKPTKKQHTLSFRERKTNLSGAFRLIDRELVRDKKLLIVDDIITSGFTLSTCCKTLRRGKPTAIFCATIASAKNRYPENGMI